MSTVNSYDWVDFYKTFAGKLLVYKDKRNDLIDIIKDVFNDAGITIPTLEKDNDIVDIDPFTVFGLFNKSTMKQENRIKIISSFAKKMSIKTPIPTSFASLPVLNAQNATFYNFKDTRSDDEIDNLWQLFISALQYASDPIEKSKDQVSKYFDIAIAVKGNGNSKITMGLYWIAPDTYLNLDKRNIWYIYDTGKFPSEVVSSLPEIDDNSKLTAKDYFEIVDKVSAYLQSSKSTLKDFKELSEEAWSSSKSENERIREEHNRDNREPGLPDSDVDTVHYWMYSPGENASKWNEFYSKGIMAIGWSEVGDLNNYSSSEQINEKMKETIDSSRHFKNISLAAWQFSHTMKKGDIVFAKKGRNQLVGKGIVDSDYYFDGSVHDGYNNIRKVKWTDRGEWEHPGTAGMKTLTDITSYTEYVKRLTEIFGDAAESEITSEVVNYDRKKFLEDVYMSSSSYDELVDLCKEKKNVILAGVPGVGKTYAAKRLAYSIIGNKDQERVKLIQFHQSYSYEDFIEGYRPNDNGQFEIKKGVFYDFCDNAKDDINNDYFFIIDEINRGNLSKIFGEAFMLIEKDKRGNYIQLLYSKEQFTIPKNVVIIGTMNTADRSLAIIDYALRRRFAFFEMQPAFNSDGFRSYMVKLGNEKLNHLVSAVIRLNEDIRNDESLGEGFCIGHSYFCDLHGDINRSLNRIVEYELVPLLKEYWFDEQDKVALWTDQLRRSIQ